MILRYVIVISVLFCSQNYAQYFHIRIEDEPLVVLTPTPLPNSPAGSEIVHKITPLDAMVDKTNYLGFRILYLHSKSNKNNIAFSPCGVGSVLVALYEGSQGISASEIHDNLVVPLDKDILRVGYRDIHRRLRSYFYQNENLLSGLTLSSENITIRSEYESILRFYGYDLETIPEMQPTPTTTEKIDESSTEEDDSNSTVTIQIDITTKEGSTELEIESSTEDSDENDVTTIILETETPGKSTESVEFGSAENETTTATSQEQTSTENAENSTNETEQVPVETETSEQAAVEITEEPEIESKKRSLRSRSKQRQSRSKTIKLTRAIIRAKRQHDDFDFVGHQKFLQTFLLQDTVPTPPPFAAFPSFSGLSNNQFLDRSSDDTIEHNFYLSEYESVKVPYKFYNTILKYAYVEEIHSTILELELDSEYYKMIIILPDYEFGLANLMKLMQTDKEAPTLREIVQKMTPVWVKTIVPKFLLKGNIILTNDLQNMGINDIFEPTRADFTPMTDDPMIYAKHIEQSININIRTQSMQQLKRFTSHYKNPIEMAINYPFLFCILDNELDLALITGRILNPLNARIH